jgi:hypothetical protein
MNSGIKNASTHRDYISTHSEAQSVWLVRIATTR